MSKPLVAMEGIDKRFPGVHALKNCQLELEAGEVLGLVGENGAGKSTLMKILTGVYQKDEGSIFFNGNEVDFHYPKQAQDKGISIIHQELNLMPDLTVAQNIFIGREPRNFSNLFLDEKQLNNQTKKLFKQMNQDLDPYTKVSELSVAHQQMVEIAKALTFNSEVLIMDEPTAALSNTEIDDLFSIIEQLTKDGVGIIYISHRMDELKRITDRITVMRDGQYIDTVKTAEVTNEKIISMMVGRKVYQSDHSNKTTTSNKVVLEVKNLNRGSTIKDVSFRLKKGEILGISGLMGAGRTEVARAIFGADPIDSGDIYINGEKVKVSSPHDAVRYGVGYLSEDRKQFGVMLDMDVKTNIVAASFHKFNKLLGWINERKVKEVSKEKVEILKVKTPSTEQQVRYLSGGNQQKVVIAKWLTRDSEVLIFDEPTRGIDVGAKNEIYELLNDLVKQGKSIIMISSELPEILRMSDRIIVMCEGRITAELDGMNTTQEEIMSFATLR